VVQSLPKPGGGVVGKSPSILRRGFLIPSAPSPFSGCASPIIGKGANFGLDGLTQSHKWPSGVGLSGEIFFTPWVYVIPTCPWIGCRMGLEMTDVQILILARARIICNIVYVQV